MKRKELKALLTIYRENIETTNVMVREKIAIINQLDMAGVYDENTVAIIDQYYKDFEEIIYGYFEQITRLRKLREAVKHDKIQTKMVEEYSKDFRHQLWSTQLYLISRRGYCKDNIKKVSEPQKLKERIERLAIAIYILENLV